MQKLKAENKKLQENLKNLKRRYKKLQHEVDEDISNKLSLNITKLGLLFTAGVTLGRLLK